MLSNRQAIETVRQIRTLKLELASLRGKVLAKGNALAKLAEGTTEFEATALARAELQAEVASKAERLIRAQALLA